MSDDDLLTPREAEDFTGRRYGWLEQDRRMLNYIRREHPEEVGQWIDRQPPWVMVGRRVMYRRGDLAPFVTPRAGPNRNGTCGVCQFFEHEDWERDVEWFNPDRAYCTWADTMTEPKDAPRWLRGALRQRVNAKGGRTCPAFLPRIMRTPTETNAEPVSQ